MDVSGLCIKYVDGDILDILVYGLNVRIYVGRIVFKPVIRVGRIVFKGVSSGREAEDKG